MRWTPWHPGIFARVAQIPGCKKAHERGHGLWMFEDRKGGNWREEEQVGYLISSHWWDPFSFITFDPICPVVPVSEDPHHQIHKGFLPALSDWSLHVARDRWPGGEKKRAERSLCTQEKTYHSLQSRKKYIYINIFIYGTYSGSKGLNMCVMWGRGMLSYPLA